MSDTRINRKLAAILAADVVGYSRLMGADEAGTLASLKRHRQTIFDPAVAAHNGRIVKLIGDGTIVEFGSVVDAVNCALSVQRSGAALPDATARQPTILLRIGINLGDVIIENDDIYGDGVNIAARLEPLAEPGGICVSSIVNESIGNRIDARFQDGGEVSVKNIDRPIRVWKWHPSKMDAAPNATDPTPSGALDRRFAVRQYVGRPRAGILLRRHQRRRYHRFVEDRRPDGHRAQLEFHLQGTLGRHS
jgi:adenylate cyclase